MSAYGPKPLPEEERIPLWVLACWKLWAWITWPAAVRELKRAGFRRTGFMTWETGPDRMPTEGDDA